MISIGVSGNQIELNSLFQRVMVGNLYIESIIKAGACPFVMAVNRDEKVIESMVYKMDGILMTGGVDINPIYFNEEPHQKMGVINDDRDFFDLAVVKYAFEMNKPILGICRGEQVINVFLGGTLYQDINSQVTNAIKHNQDETRNDTVTHKINIEKSSMLHSIIGESSVFVNSFHHQSVKDLGKGLKVSATASDGVIEAFEYEGSDRFLLGIQWHPEFLANKIECMQNIFNVFVNACKR